MERKQPAGSPRTRKLNNYPSCEMAHCVSTGLSPTWGCDECHTCGTFGPYWVNDPPPGHPIYGKKPLVYGWENVRHHDMAGIWAAFLSY
eukprot:COSAG04_NODE_10111_length_803_cov_2.504261_1_plen_89_part_00